MAEARARDLLPINRGDMIRTPKGEGRILDVIYNLKGNVRVLIESSILLHPDEEIELNVSQRGRHMVQPPQGNRRG